MDIPQLQSCFCGRPLKTGAKFVGWLCFVMSFTGIFVYYISMQLLDYVDNHPTPQNMELIEDLPTYMMACMILIGFHVIDLFFSTLLLVGVYWEKSELLVCWLIYGLVDLAIAINVGYLRSFIFFAMDLYFLLVVYSYYKKISR
uniref:Uncharacterized protein n=1 Tax=Graphocephala atropunctata TaxID=36148 RepID=A0A1B6LJB7_9HEMI